MYALQVNTNTDRPRFVRAVYGETVEEVAGKIEAEAEAVASWLRRSGGPFVEGYLADYPDEAAFCGDNGPYRYDMQLADGKGAPA